MRLVLFVCTGNYYRSRFAEGLFNHHARRADLIVALHEPEHRPMIRRRFPAWEPSITWWEVPDLGDMPPSEAFFLMEARVRDLLSRLSHGDVSAPREDDLARPVSVARA